MKVRAVFRVERCPVVTAACAVEGAGGPWALVDPRDGRHAAHARTKLEAREKARLYRRTREEAERADAGARPVEPRYTNSECDPGDPGVTMAELRALNADDPPEDLYELLAGLRPGESVDYNAGAGGIFRWTRVS